MTDTSTETRPPQSGLKNRKSEADYQRDLESHHERKDTEFINAGIESSMPIARTIGGLVVSEDITTPIKCTLRQYQDLTVYFRTNNPAERMYSLPTLRYSNDVHAMSDRINAMLKEFNDSTEAGKRLPDEYFDLKERYDRLAMVENEEWQGRKAIWLSSFVRRIEPWNFGKATEYDEAGHVTKAEPIPAPNPGKPETYLTLLRDHESLGAWCENLGYTMAVIEAGRPFSSASEKPSSASDSSS